MALVVAPDPVARGEPPDGRPDGLDDPGHVPPHDEGEEQVLRQLATANQGVHRIDANRGGLDEHVRRADRGGGPFAELDVLRRADAVDVGGFHGSNPLRPKVPEAPGECPLRRLPLVPPSADDPAQQRRPPGDIVRRTTPAGRGRRPAGETSGTEWVAGAKMSSGPTPVGATGWRGSRIVAFRSVLVEPRTMQPPDPECFNGEVIRRPVWQVLRNLAAGALRELGWEGPGAQVFVEIRPGVWPRPPATE